MLKQLLLFPTCASCGSLFCHDSMFCLYCLKKEVLIRAREPLQSHLNEQHIYLLKWNKNESDGLSQIVYRLKSDQATSAWRYYAELICKKRKIDFKKYDALIPIPGSKSTSVHALIFAQEISKICGLPIWNSLSKKPQNGAQKKLNARERAQSLGIVSKLESHEQFTKCLFIDDIVTTGQTYLQSRNALKLTESSPILSLLYRTKQSFE